MVALEALYYIQKLLLVVLNYGYYVNCTLCDLPVLFAGKGVVIDVCTRRIGKPGGIVEH